MWSALLACLLAALALAVPPAHASSAPPRAQHVVVVGLSGLRWSDVSQARTPALGRLAGQGEGGAGADGGGAAGRPAGQQAPVGGVVELAVVGLERRQAGDAGTVAGRLDRGEGAAGGGGVVGLRPGA